MQPEKQGRKSIKDLWNNQKDYTIGFPQQIREELYEGKVITSFLVYETHTHTDWPKQLSSHLLILSPKTTLLGTGVRASKLLPDWLVRTQWVQKLLLTVDCCKGTHRERPIGKLSAVNTLMQEVLNSSTTVVTKQSCHLRILVTSLVSRMTSSAHVTATWLLRLQHLSTKSKHVFAINHTYY